MDNKTVKSIWDQIKDGFEPVKDSLKPVKPIGEIISDHPEIVEPIGDIINDPDFHVNEPETPSTDDPGFHIGPKTRFWDKIPGIATPDTKIPEPYLIQPVSNDIGLQVMAQDDEGKYANTVERYFGSSESDTDKIKQAFVNVAALTEIKSVADENGQYDAEKVEAATNDVADYYNARQALDFKFGKMENSITPLYDDKAKAAMDVGYEAALAELNNQYGEDTVKLYNKTQEKIEAYEKAESEKYISVPDKFFSFFDKSVPNPDYDPDFAKNDPDLADVAYAKGQMSAADYKAASGKEYKSNDPEKVYIKTEDMCNRVDSYVNQFEENVLDGINEGKETFADAIHDITTSPAMVALGAKAFALKNAAVENGGKVFDTVENKLDDLTNGKFSNGVDMMKTAFSSAVETMENKVEQAKQTKTARGHEFDGQFSSDTGMELDGLSQ